MSDSVVKLRIDSKEYDANIKRAGQALTDYFNKVKEGKPCKSCDLSWVCDNCPAWMEQVCGARGDGMNFKKAEEEVGT